MAAQLLKNELVHTVNGPWWLIQLWLNLHMHKFLRPNLKSLSFPSSNFDEEYRGEEGRTRQCTSYGEAASAIIIDFDVGHLFKKLYRGFDAAILTWLLYNEDDELIFHSNSDLNPAVRTRQRLRFSIPLLSPVFSQLNFITVVAKWLKVPPS